MAEFPETDLLDAVKTLTSTEGEKPDARDAAVSVLLIASTYALRDIAESLRGIKRVLETKRFT